MIPVRLQLSGFLSYRDPVDVDFTSFDLACISGHNGAGKSSLLDAITWALFGQARRRDDALINSRCDAAEVIFDFDYEGNRYRVQRSKPRDKSNLVEFYVRSPEGTWKPLTEHTLRETEQRIQETLRMDYETFTNASFFLQGKADQFTQQRPGDRKRILSNVLGLEIWEKYREACAAQRKNAERDLAGIQGQIQEIESELAEEDARRARLETLEKELERLGELRSLKEASLENVRRLALSLEEQRRLVEMLSSQLESVRRRRDERQAQLHERRQEQHSYQEHIATADQIEKDYAQWLKLREALENWEQLAARFQQFQHKRNAPLTIIETERTRLEEERRSLVERQAELQAQQALLPELEEKLNLLYSEMGGLREEQVERARLNDEYLTLNDELTEIRAENKKLKQEMLDLRERINRLEAVEEDTCPVCGQPLRGADREYMIINLTEQGNGLKAKYLENQAVMQAHEEKIRLHRQRIDALADLDARLQANQQQVASLEVRKEAVIQAVQTWESSQAGRLVLLQEQIETGNFAAQARAELDAIDQELKSLGYDPQAHETARRAEMQARESDEHMRLLQTARAALAPLEREIASLEKDLAADEDEMQTLQTSLRQAEDKYRSDAADLPDLAALEREVSDLKTRENQLRMQVGGARQSVEVLTSLRARMKTLDARRGEISQLITRLKTLERAFGKDGVPALLIEQALPEIEAQANEFLDRLSNGSMSVQFETQREFKDKKRDDKRETLDILINDPAGTREYEMFSGGEAFRVNFAIRLALSRVLARRAGARLQTLVIDEGFGSQDSDGRQRLIEAINQVHADFAKILVITHLEELKDAFPARIEVEKTNGSSSVRVMAA